MSKNRMINTKFWSDGWIINLEPLERYLFLYLLTNEHTNICGIYELPLKIIERESGIDIETIQSILIKLKDKILYFEDWVYIKNFLKHQKSSGNVKLGIEAGLKEVPERIMASIKGLLDTPPSDPLMTPDTPQYLNINSNLNLNLNNNNIHVDKNFSEKELKESACYRQEFFMKLTLEERKQINEWIKDFTDPQIMRSFEIKYGVKGWVMAKVTRYGMDKFKKAYDAGQKLKDSKPLSLYDRAKTFFNILYS